MKYLNGEYYVEVKDHRYKIHPTESIIVQKGDPPTSLTTHYQVQTNIQIRNNQKSVENNGKLEVKNYPKIKQRIIQKPKFKPPNCPTCKQNKWLEINKCYYCKNCEYIINKQKHQIDKKVLRQDRDFSTRLIYANKKIREIWMNMVNTIYISTEDMVDRLQQLERKTKIKIYKNKSNCYDNILIRMDEDTFAQNARGISKIHHEVFLLMNSLQTKP